MAIVLAEVELPRTHDLEQLKEQVEATGPQLPPELAGVDWLTPWAVALRYDEPKKSSDRVSMRISSKSVSVPVHRMVATRNAPACSSQIQADGCSKVPHLSLRGRLASDSEADSLGYLHQLANHSALAHVCR